MPRIDWSSGFRVDSFAGLGIPSLGFEASRCLVWVQALRGSDLGIQNMEYWIRVSGGEVREGEFKVCGKVRGVGCVGLFGSLVLGALRLKLTVAGG